MLESKEEWDGHKTFADARAIKFSKDKKAHTHTHTQMHTQMHTHTPCNDFHELLKIP